MRRRDSGRAWSFVAHEVAVEANDEDVLVRVDLRAAHRGRHDVAAFAADDDTTVGRAFTVRLREGERIGPKLLDLGGRRDARGVSARPAEAEPERDTDSDDNCSSAKSAPHAIFSSGA
jgi:hypothetical protein